MDIHLVHTVLLFEVALKNNSSKKGFAGRTNPLLVNTYRTRMLDLSSVRRSLWWEREFWQQIVLAYAHQQSEFAVGTKLSVVEWPKAGNSMGKIINMNFRNQEELSLKSSFSESNRSSFKWSDIDSLHHAACRDRSFYMCLLPFFFLCHTSK